MTNKGEAARTRILESAQVLFSRKGYCAVTMQDICEAAGFSRGGLYRHYASTEEIFVDIIRTEQREAYAELQRAKDLNVGPDKIMFYFLRSRMRWVCRSERSFDVAVSEFAANSELGRNALAIRARESIEVLTELIEQGNREGFFRCDCPQDTAKHIMWLTEGMSRHSSLLPVTEEDMQQQLALIRRLLGQD